MEQATTNIGQIVDSSKQFARRLITIGENRLELLMVEVQEERERLLHAMFLALGVTAFGFLAFLALNIVTVVLFWNVSPIAVLLVLAAIYAVSGFCLYRRLDLLLRNWKSLPATLDQLRKDRECLEKSLS
jgi:uncharacterized membrane protein YqjE